MRIGLNIPEETYGRLKVKAADENTSVREIVLRGIARELEPTKILPLRKLKLPLIRSSRPGTLHLANEEIDEILSS